MMHIKDIGYEDGWKERRISRESEEERFMRKCKEISTNTEKCDKCEFRYKCYTLEHKETTLFGEDLGAKYQKIRHVKK